MSSDFQKIDFIPYGHPVFGASWEEWYPIPSGARVAVIVLEPAARRYPDAFSYSDLANTYRAAGEIESAIAGYKKVLELDPKNENARQALRELKR